MLTLNADSACDVCAEEYGPFNLPRCIPCGHVLCAVCAESIIEKTSPRLTPTCPFCRESFARDGVRVIRIDFSGSSGGGAASTSTAGYGVGENGLGVSETCINGGAASPNHLDDETVLYDVRTSRSPIHSARSSRDPSRATSPERSNVSSQHNGIFTTIIEDHPALPASFDANVHKDRARELEKKVAKVATKRCSAEEVQALQRELGEWLAVDKVLGSSGFSSCDKQQHAAIHLSHLLLRAILMNHLAHSEASRVAKGAEAQLRARIADGELVREKLDADLRKTRNLLQTRSHEVSLLKTELARFRGEEYAEFVSQGHGQGAVTPTRRQSLSAPTSPDGYFPSFGISSASTAVPPTSSSRSNRASGANSPCSSGRTTPTAGLALGSSTSNLMPMGSTFPPIEMTLNAGMAGSTASAMMTTSGGMSSASAAAHSSRTPVRPQSTAPSRFGMTNAGTPIRPQSTAPSRAAPASPTPAPGSTSGKYAHGHMRSASMIHRSATATPGLSSSSASAAAATSTASPSRDRRSMTPAPIHQRSASVAPGSSSGAAARGLSRSSTPNPSARESAGNGSSAGVASFGGVSGSGIPPVPALPMSKEREALVPVSALSHSFQSSFRDTSSSASSSVGVQAARPPVPPKPRTLSHSSPNGAGTVRGGRRDVVDDRDGYTTEKDVKKEKKSKMHERWLPSALVDRMNRPATSQA
ncbi:uncharacterized protein FOMMEDRAFT_25065 [Fomitiporia mediterranea MF3/22]|uniref:uncharacterized protein n=1 Tax=Fomitiporia mediterranea (strain MF3/22) TaxID=694068 RepID=UPI0004408C67|nr:uncharacterized protein FOMMEDRAFT_25065 [Fomitiporia mediterranea MF3/22]EJD07786.1 hypothetical protein FOMMEDRAFT_25065 [Fomitiporia mediterranea MF3/22]